MKLRKTGMLSALVAVMLLMVTISGCNGAAVEQEEGEKTAQIVIWHYFNDAQSEQLNELISEYNATRGSEIGVEISALGQGTTNDLSTKIDVILNGSTNQVDTPDMFYAYRDMVADVLESHPEELADYRDYFSEEELASYHDDYLEEGYFGDALYIMPLAKSTELLMVNQTALKRFLEENPQHSETELATWEGIHALAEDYYRWTDEKTPEPGDGKAFLGMDEFPNYFISQNRAFGSSIYTEDEEGNIQFDLDKEVIQKLFLNYYIPFTKGYYMGTENRRSDDLRQTRLVCYVGSLSSALYFPASTYDENGVKEDIDLKVYFYPHFADGEKVAVQQGAGVAMVDKGETTKEACVDFLKWLTFEKGTEYAAGLSYMPVAEAALQSGDLSFMEEGNVKLAVEQAISQSRSYHMTRGFSFPGALDMRNTYAQYFADCMKKGRAEYEQYLEDGLHEEEAAESMNYEEKAEDFYEGVTDIFK